MKPLYLPRPVSYPGRMKTLIALLALASLASADTLRLRNGGTLEGVVLRETDGAVVVRLKYATVTIDRAEIEAIEKKAGAPDAAGLRLARWDKAVETAAARPWGVDLRQIPATVIDKGVLKNVPYISHRAGDYELNLYGDPDAPAGLEIGLPRARSAEAKKECLEVLASLLSDPEDVKRLRSLSLAQDRQERAGLVFEVTPETAEDAYGGWWITVYDAKALEEARLSEEDLKEASKAEEDLEDDEPEPKHPEAKKPEPKKPAAARRPVQEVIYVWRRPEVRQQARPVKTGQIRRVWVRGLHRVKGAWQRPGGIRIRR
jgi:hypothetical protein